MRVEGGGVMEIVVLLVRVVVNARAVSKTVFTVEENGERGEPKGTEAAGSASRLGEPHVQTSRNDERRNIHLETG